jgi:hypothetical protein
VESVLEEIAGGAEEIKESDPLSNRIDQGTCGADTMVRAVFFDLPASVIAGAA